MFEWKVGEATEAAGIETNRSLIILLVSMAALSVGCQGSASPTPSPSTSLPSNHSPVVTSVTVSPAFGVSGLTSIAMQAAATDVDGDALSYAWSFGGGTATGASATAKVTGDGLTAITVTVSDGRGGTATSSQTVTIGTMTGSWDFVAGTCGTNSGEKPAVFVLTQTGTTVNGVLNFPTRWCNVPANAHGEISPAAPGTIDAQGSFELIRLPVGAFLDSRLFGGKMSLSGRSVTGRIYQSGFDGEAYTMTKR